MHESKTDQHPFSRWPWMAFGLILSLLFSQCQQAPDQKKADSKNQEVYDVVVYGGTSAGVIAAVAAKRMSQKVLLVSPDKHLGGLTSGGLGATDVGNKKAFRGLALDFYRRAGAYYDQLEAWRFEPHVAEQVFQDYVKEDNIPVVYQYRVTETEKEGSVLQALRCEAFGDSSGQAERNFYARQFIDASYEGDLMARAGVSYTVGRDGNAPYGEEANGFHISKHHQFMDGVDPYIVPGDSSSGLCWGIQDLPPRPTGSGDSLVQAYNFRLCLSYDSANARPFYKPKNYDRERYRLLTRWIKKNEAQYPKEWKTVYWNYFRVVDMPKQKTDVNNKGAFSTDMIGYSWDYPEADYALRDSIKQLHEEYIQGLLYFMANDTAVEAGVRQEMQEWGYARDEFEDNNNFPYALYVREARRMVSDLVMTEHHVLLKEPVEDTIAFGAYQMDSHNCERIVINGMVKNEGDIQNAVEQPYPISYRILRPKKEECQNLMVPVCVSASHIAFGSIRMEPVFMALGQVAGMAAALANEHGTAVQEVDYREINRLTAEEPYLKESRQELIIDDKDRDYIQYSACWQTPNEKTHRAEWGLYGNTYLSCQGATAQKLGIEVEGLEENSSYELYYFASDLGEDTKSGVQISWGEGKSKTISHSSDPGNWVYVSKVSPNKGTRVEITPLSPEKVAWFDALFLRELSSEE